MKIKENKGFITIYVMLSMIFLIMLITVALINVSGKLRTQTEANTEIYKMYNNKNIENMIIDYTTEIPVYTKEEFEHLKDWIISETSKTEYMYINGLFYKLEEGTKADYKIILKSNIYLEENELYYENDKYYVKIDADNNKEINIICNDFYMIYSVNEIPIYKAKNVEKFIDWIEYESKIILIHSKGFSYELKPENKENYILDIKSDLKFDKQLLYADTSGNYYLNEYNEGVENTKINIKINEFKIIYNILEIPIYTKEDFDKFKNWIKNGTVSETITIRGFIYELDIENKQNYVAHLKANIKLETGELYYDSTKQKYYLDSIKTILINIEENDFTITIG